MERKIYCIFTAGGKGVRMGGAVPKQFLLLDGVPVLQRTISRLVAAVPDMHVIVTLPSGSLPYWKGLCEEYVFDCPHQVVEGGIERFFSVRNALEKVPDGVTVMIHDGVRPFVSDGMIRRLLEAAEDNPAVIPVTKVTDTLRSAVQGRPAPDRSSILAVQTPQVFRSEVIKEAYSKAYKPSFTDDASVAEENGIPVTCVEGDRYNIKITAPEDLAVARALLRIR